MAAKKQSRKMTKRQTAKRKTSTRHSAIPKAGPKVGSSGKAAAKIGGRGDFGARESDLIERTYVSKNTKASDRGNAQPRSGADGDRQSGVGGKQTGVGSSSGGEVDTDIVGVGMRNM